MAKWCVLEGGSIANNRAWRNVNLMQFKDDEYANDSDLSVVEEVF